MRETVESGRPYIEVPRAKKLRFRPFSRSQALPPGTIYAQLVKFQIHNLESMLDVVREEHASEIETLTALVTKREEEGAEGPDYSNEFWRLEETGKLTEQLAVVGLYRVVELMTKRILMFIYERDYRTLRRTSQSDRLKERLLQDFGVELKEVRDYLLIDELRCLSNAIKHEGIISEDLGRFEGWSEGKRIERVRSHFHRFAPAIPGYIEDLVRRLNSYLSKHLPPPPPLSSEDLAHLGIPDAEGG